MTAHDRRNSAGLTECVIQPSATRPTRSSARAEPPVPLCPLDRRAAFVVSQIGHGACTGLGSSVMPLKRIKRPSNGSLSRAQRWRSTWTFSIMRRRRSAGGMSIAAVSASHAPPPPPEHTDSPGAAMRQHVERGPFVGEHTWIAQCERSHAGGAEKHGLGAAGQGSKQSEGIERGLTNRASPTHSASSSGEVSTASANASNCFTVVRPSRTPRLASVMPKRMVPFRTARRLPR